MLDRYGPKLSWYDKFRVDPQHCELNEIRPVFTEVKHVDGWSDMTYTFIYFIQRKQNKNVLLFKYIYNVPSGIL